MANYDEELRFKQGGDTGENDSASVQPLADGERLWALTIDRAVENLRKRTEVVRAAVEELNFESDYQRGLVFSSLGTFALTQYSAPAGTYGVEATAELRIVPALVPNDARSGGRVVAFPSGAQLSGARLFVGANSYIGTLGVNDLWIFADPSATGQRGYADGQDMNTLTVKSVGANDISFELIVDGGLAAGQVTFDAVDGVPTRHITVRYGDGTTIGQLRDAINNDRVGGATQSQGGGTWGVGEMIRAATTVDPATTVLTGGDLISVAETTLQGSYDAEMHVVTAAQLATFFAVSANRLKDGEALVLAYPAGPVQAGGAGGRRQSLIDYPTSRLGAAADNTGRLAAGAGMLVNAGLHPEQLPGAIPIGRMSQGRFVFADGTILKPAVALDAPGQALYLGESIYTLERLSGAGGATNVQYDGSGNWNADQVAAPTNVPASNLEVALDTLVAALAASTTNASGSRRIGAEAITGAASSGNVARSLVAGSLRQQLDTLLNATGSASTAGGVNARVSEYGHSLKGYAGLRKDYPDTAPAGGASVIEAEITAPVGGQTFNNDHLRDPAIIRAKPLVYNLGGGDGFGNNEITGLGAATDKVRIDATVLGITNFRTRARAALGVARGSGANTVPALLARIADATPTSLNKYYWVHDVIVADLDVQLRNLDGTVPNFTGIGGAPPILEVFEAVVEGGHADGSRSVAFQMAPAPLGHIVRSSNADPVLKVWDSATYAGWAGNPPSAIHYPDRSIWRVGQTNGGAVSISKDTDAILHPDDADLLRGQENLNPVDATASHHHGGTYTRLFTPTIDNTAAGQIRWDAGGVVVAADFTQFPTFYHSADVLAFVPAGYTVLGVYSELFAQVEVTGAAGTAWDFMISTTPGVAYSTTNTRTVMARTGYKPTAGAETYSFVETVLVPTDSLGRAAFTVSPGAPVSAAASTLSVRPSALLLRRT